MSKVKEKKKNRRQKDFESILELLFDETRFASMEKIRLFQEKKEQEQNKSLKPKKQWFFAQ